MDAAVPQRSPLLGLLCRTAGPVFRRSRKRPLHHLPSRPVRELALGPDQVERAVRRNYSAGRRDRWPVDQRARVKLHHDRVERRRHRREHARHADVASVPWPEPRLCSVPRPQIQLGHQAVRFPRRRGSIRHRGCRRPGRFRLRRKVFRSRRLQRHRGNGEGPGRG